LADAAERERVEDEQNVLLAPEGRQGDLLLVVVGEREVGSLGSDLERHVCTLLIRLCGPLPTRAGNRLARLDAPRREWSRILFVPRSRASLSAWTSPPGEPPAGCPPSPSRR